MIGDYKTLMMPVWMTDVLQTFGVNGLLVSQLLEHFGGSGKTITRFTDAAIDNELINLKLTQRVLCLLFLRHHSDSYIWNEYRAREG